MAPGFVLGREVALQPIWACQHCCKNYSSTSKSRLATILLCFCISHKDNETCKFRNCFCLPLREKKSGMFLGIDISVQPLPVYSTGSTTVVYSTSHCNLVPTEILSVCFWNRQRRNNCSHLLWATGYLQQWRPPWKENSVSQAGINWAKSIPGVSPASQDHHFHTLSPGLQTLANSPNYVAILFLLTESLVH